MLNIFSASTYTCLYGKMLVKKGIVVKRVVSSTSTIPLW